MINDYSEVTASIRLDIKELEKLLANRDWDDAWFKADGIKDQMGELQDFLIKKEHG